MAELNARTDTFVALILNVSGRARVGDLSDLMPPEAALALLQAYKAAHPEMPLFFDGDALIYGVPASEAAPAFAAPAPYGVPAAVEAPAAPAPPAAVAAAPAEELPSWYFEDGSGVPTAPLDTMTPVPADLGTPMEFAAPAPAEIGAAAAVPAAEAVPQPASPPAPAPSDPSDFVDLPAADFAMPGDDSAGAAKPKRTRVLVYAIVAVLVLAVLAAAAYVVFFGGAIPSMG